MKLEFKDYCNKVKGCYLGKNIGGTLGAPFECFRGVYDIDFFMQDVSSPVPNDDVDLQLVWLSAVEHEGKNIDSHTLAQYWENYVSAVISEYGTGKNNYSMGILPPLSGYLRNENRESNGAWIRTEIWACLCAGNPALAANYAYYDACVDHSGEGIYAAVFTATVEAAAFFESDKFKLIEIGLSYLPEKCGVRNAVNVVLQSFKSGDDWKTARKKLLIAEPSSFGEIGGEWKGTPLVPASKKCPVQQKDYDIPKAVHGYDAPASIGIILIGWLYGGDFGKSVCIATNCGEDTDCTAGTLGAILGIISGESGIPEKWKKGCSEKIAICTLRPDLLLNVPETVSALCERVIKQFPVISSERCTFTQNGFEIQPTTLSYDDNAFYPYQQENFKELLAESPSTVRFHFSGLTVKVNFGETLAKIEEGVEKKITVTLSNKLYLSQYLTVRISGVPEEWSVSGGTERAVGLEHWHGSKVSHTNSFNLIFTPKLLKNHKYELTLEISANGRGEKRFVPVTLINGAFKMLFENGQKIVFIGDSVTDAGRKRPVGDGLWEGTGTGYVRLIESFLNVFYPERLIHIVNMGISGNTSSEVLARFDSDALGLNPDYAVICVGFNDVWRYFDCPSFKEQITLTEYTQNLNAMIDKCAQNGVKVILMSPYFLEPNLADPMRKKADEYRAACSDVAKKRGTLCIDLQKAFDELLKYRYSAYITWDRVHPGHVGSMLIAVEFLKNTGFDFNRLAV